MRALSAFTLGVLSLTLLALNTLFWSVPLFLLATLKLLVPIPAVRRRLTPVLNRIATAWISCNDAWIGLLQRQPWSVDGAGGLHRGGWYLVVCNHRSWVDIFVLQRVLNLRIPLLKFFLKQQLIYVPVIGLAWWALDFPFMRRHSRTALRKRPELRDQDLDTTRRACAKFASVPTSVMNFAEGTRYTAGKHRSQASPYRHLLKPRAGALALTLNTMGRQFHSLLDISIAYPDGTPSFWELASGKAGRVMLHVRELQIPADLCSGDYSADAAFRSQFHRWLAQLWEEKDQRIETMLTQAAR
ncbi:acyltransferase [Ralstonia solanacearum]|uniref:Acyltransferase n=1 Tax=Ralstonia solanacearum K60 TaxID=1091042 RepID=A0AAP8D2E1_RALSL|nr:acyltransferase [Ralstonia solanacearum]MBT1538973.1 acyltransferase [Ralstonia solanacearum]OYQ10002.1 acyltransferase [Ralstonia solanacearum K60]QOK84785.1 acyltransferase [Ralstonia solanacearum]RIJ83900.1 acyltransferase [Ralstonia solanacearum]